MSVVAMTKLKLMGLSYHKERILNTLHKSGVVELKNVEELEDTFTCADEKVKEELVGKYERAKESVDFFLEHIEKAKDKEYYPKNAENAIKNFFVSYDEFMSASGNEMELSYVIDKTEDYAKRLLNNRTNRIKLNNMRVQLEPFSAMKEKFSSFTDTENTKVFLGTIKQDSVPVFLDFLKDYPYTFANIEVDSAMSVMSVVAYVDEAESVNQKLSELGFIKCPFDFDMTAKEKIAEIEKAVKDCDEFDETITKKTCGRADNLRNLKILTDYYKFQIEKQTSSENFRCTQSTFILEGYLPKEKQTEVTNALYDVTNAVFMEFAEPDENDNPPTLLKNNAVVKQTEFIVNMYSVPNYRELDPSKIVFFFYMLFFGVIMADIGYGLIMIAFGLLLARRIKVDNGTRRLWNIIAIAGVPTIIFGLLFGSVFGISIPTAVLPSPIPDGSGTQGLMTILLGCLGLGVIQIAVGYLFKALNSFKQGRVADGIFDGVVWVMFFIGFIFAAFNFIMDYMDIIPQSEALFPQILVTIGLIMVAASLLLAVLTAGRHEKGFGKFSKGFGAIYGLINLMSDILSYARLFGLMLSGMIIATTFNDIGSGLFASGAIGYLFGGLVILVGHVFNIAMGVLGAYIHDSRLQYIEFFGKFYSGEGELFEPLGSKFDYIYLTK